MTTECRRCTECEGESHHWMLDCHDDGTGEPIWTCKHCDYACESVECERCGEETPVDVANDLAGEDDEQLCGFCASELAGLRS